MMEWRLKTSWKNSKNFLEESILETVLEIYPEFRWYIQCFENENPIDLVQHIHNIDIRFRDLVNDLGGNYFLIYVKDLKSGMSYFLYLSCVKKPVVNDVNPYQAGEGWNPPASAFYICCFITDQILNTRPWCKFIFWCLEELRKKKLGVPEKIFWKKCVWKKKLLENEVKIMYLYFTMSIRIPGQTDLIIEIVVISDVWR